MNVFLVCKNYRRFQFLRNALGATPLSLTYVESADPIKLRGIGRATIIFDHDINLEDSTWELAVVSLRGHGCNLFQLTEV